MIFDLLHLENDRLPFFPEVGNRCPSAQSGTLFSLVNRDYLEAPFGHARHSTKKCPGFQRQRIDHVQETQDAWLVFESTDSRPLIPNRTGGGPWQFPQECESTGQDPQSLLRASACSCCLKKATSRIHGTRISIPFLQLGPLFPHQDHVKGFGIGVRGPNGSFALR